MHLFNSQWLFLNIAYTYFILELFYVLWLINFLKLSKKKFYTNGSIKSGLKLAYQFRLLKFLWNHYLRQQYEYPTVSCVNIYFVSQDYKAATVLDKHLFLYNSKNYKMCRIVKWELWTQLLFLEAHYIKSLVIPSVLCFICVFMILYSWNSMDVSY